MIIIRVLSALVLALTIWPGSTAAAEPPALTLPTPRGETWEVIQGYNCGTHEGDWGQLSFDLVNHDRSDRTQGAPVYAAAEGTFWYWGAESGSLIINHGAGYFTMYTHMESHVDLVRGTPIARGAPIGTVGNVGASHTIPHLHFTFFQRDESAAERQPLTLSFADGYAFPDDGTCNNHGGALVRATGLPRNDFTPQVAWSGVAPKQWHREGQLGWTIANAATSTYQWDVAPSAELVPKTPAAATLALTKPGRHTLFVRTWTSTRGQALLAREYWYDPLPPAFTPTQRLTRTIATDGLTMLRWQPAADELSGIKGYRVYIGPNSHGESERFAEAALVTADLRNQGRVYVRVQAEDQAGNRSGWATLQTISGREPGARMPRPACPPPTLKPPATCRQ